MALSTKDKYRLCREQQRLFSKVILERSLYKYQTIPAQFVLDQVRQSIDSVTVIEMPRQSGKNEMSAHLELNILAQSRKTGGEIVKAAPTFRPQVVASKTRFTKLAAQAAEHYPWMAVTPQEGYMFRNGRAGISFFSADKKSNVVGATASLLLELDEAQEINRDKLEKDFAPMRASTGAPLVLYGTTWLDDTLLELHKQWIGEGRIKGRVFRILPDEVAAENPAYGSFVDGQVALLGRQHPSIKTQYFLEVLENQGRMLSKQQLVQMMGTHTRKESRENQNIIVAGLDWAGADEQSGQVVSLNKLSARDSVALTIASVEWQAPIAGILEPVVRILARYEWVDIPPLSLHNTIYTILNDKWRVNRVVCDATGIGATGSSLLGKSLDNSTGTRLTTRVMDAAWKAHTELASQYIGLINGSRLLDYKNDTFNPLEESQRDRPNTKDPDAHAWYQRGKARLEARESRRYRAYLAEADGHDDLLMSELLCVDAALALGGVGEFKQTRRASFG